MSASQQYQRAGAQWLFAECVAIVGWYREGDAIAEIARRLRRRAPEVRQVLFGAAE